MAVDMVATIALRVLFLYFMVPSEFFHSPLVSFVVVMFSFFSTLGVLRIWLVCT